MKEAIINYLKTTAGKHVFFIVLAVVAFIVGRSWLQEHDARLQADATVKTAQTTIDTLAKQQTATAQAAKVEVTVLQKQADAVKTPLEAAKALPTVETQPLNAVSLPDAPTKVSVDVMPLFQSLSTCKQDAVNLGACGKELDIEKQIDGQKDVEITALKKKPGFWHRVKTTLITLGVGTAAGYAIAHR